MVLLNKVVSKDILEYLQSLPDTVANRPNHNTHQSSNIIAICTKTKFYSDYFLSSSIKFMKLITRYLSKILVFEHFKNRIKIRIRNVLFIIIVVLEWDKFYIPG